MAKSPRLLYLVTEDWYFCSHRLPLARAALDEGYEVFVATRVNEHGQAITRAGLRLLPIQLSRRSVHPLRELKTWRELFTLYREVRADIVHHVALKPVLYGTLAARLTGIRGIVNALPGLGYSFTSNSVRARLFRCFLERGYKEAFAANNTRVIVQNPEDRALLIKRRIARAESIRLIRGSGVDLEVFKPTLESTREPVVLLASRMLWDKGVGEFVEAAKILKPAGVRFVLVGDTDSENPSAIPLAQLETWKKNGWIEYWGHREDMPAVLSAASVVCLPSYREGLPKVLIEAAACARPIVASDVPGCREIVRHGENGLLVPPKDVNALVLAVKQLISDGSLRQRMGIAGRQIAEDEFSIDRVIEHTLALYRELLPQ